MAQMLSSSVIFCSILLLTLGWSLGQDINPPKEDNIDEHGPRFNYTSVLNFWEEHKREFVLDGEHKNVVVVMGLTGVGKTTLALALTGQKLMVTEEVGDIRIVDYGGRIGHGTSSRTLIPEVMVDHKRNVTYVDCPGFRENRDVRYEVSALYFQNVLMNQVEKIKIILVINYQSLVLGGNRLGFDFLLEHLSGIVKDIPKFHDGIAIVAMKVPYYYRVNANGTATLLNNDPLVLDAMAKFLREKKESYLNKTDYGEKYQTFANLIDILLEKKNDSYSRLAFFRQPMQAGLLESIPGKKKEIDGIVNMIVENLQYVRKQKDDFGFALSSDTRSSIDEIIEYIFKKRLLKHLRKINNEILVYYLQMEKQYSDITKLHEQIKRAYSLIAEMKHVNQLEKMFVEYLNVANRLDIPISSANLNVIADDIRALRFFTTVSDNQEEKSLMLLTNERSTFIDSMYKLNAFYSFLDDLERHFSNYNSPELRDDSRVKDILAFSTNTTNRKVQDIPYLEKIAKKMSSDKYQEIKNWQLNQYRLHHLKNVLRAFASGLEFDCESATEPMVVKGYNIKMSKVVKIDCWKQAKKIYIFAKNKVYIDRSIDRTGDEVQLFIFAPTWEIYGSRINIILNGEEGDSHDKASAKSAFTNSENGANGLPGLPGGFGGNFFGIGQKFVSLEELNIQANGGRGGPGQNGGDGADGVAGEGLEESFFNTERSPTDLGSYLAKNNYVYSLKQLPINCNALRDVVDCDTRTDFDIDVPGKLPKKPTNGGNGGVGGKGGHPGQVMIIGLEQSITVKSTTNPGPTGSEGQGGRGGNGTSEGRRVKFILSYGYDYIPYPINGKYKKIEWTDGALIPAGENGIPGNNTIRQKYPKTLDKISLHSAINSYKDFLRANLFENIKKSEMRSFIDKLDNDNQIKAQYNTLAFIKELEGLENQFLELGNKIDFVPFYNSFLNRVEQFAQSESTWENKKVLSYIYTAALTKIVTLNKKRKGEAVLDLSIYLNDIKETIKEIDKSRHLQIVQQYKENYENTLTGKIKEANDFIQNVIEPEIDKLWDESENQIKAIIQEIEESRNSTKKAIETYEKDKSKIRKMLQLRSFLLPLKLAASFLSFTGPVGATVSVAVTSAITISEGVLLDRTSSQGINRIHTLEPNLKLVSRVAEVINNKYHVTSEKLRAAMAKLEEYEKELPLSDKERKKKINSLKTKLREATFRKTHGFVQSAQKLKDVQKIAQNMATIINSEQDILKKKKEGEKVVHDLEKEARYEKRLRLINHAQSILNSAEIVFLFTRKLANDEGEIKRIESQISDSYQELEALEKMENQVYDIIMPDLQQIEETINEVKSSINGSSHVQLDLTKWNVRTTLRDVKSLLQKYTHRMSFELQSNIQRFMDKIDEGFSTLIDIYDRIDSYSDSVKQAEYIAHIESASMNNVQVTDEELSKAVNDLKLIIHSNILTEKYKIALNAFKQHYFPFAAHALQRFQLPTNMKLNDTETLRLKIIDEIAEMKKYVNLNKAVIGPYDQYVHPKKIFDSTVIGSEPFYVWKHDTIKDEVKKLLNGSEIVIRADVSKGPFYNAIKYNDIGINFKFENETLQSNFTSVLKNFNLEMAMIGNSYYRCGERYYFISFDEDVTIVYLLDKNAKGSRINPNRVWEVINSSHSFLSPYGMWRIKLKNATESVLFKELEIFADEKIDLELIGEGYYIEQDPRFNFEVCNENLNTLYNVENIVKVLF